MGIWWKNCDKNLFENLIVKINSYKLIRSYYIWYIWLYCNENFVMDRKVDV